MEFFIILLSFRRVKKLSFHEVYFAPEQQPTQMYFHLQVSFSVVVTIDLIFFYSIEPKSIGELKILQEKIRATGAKKKNNKIYEKSYISISSTYRCFFNRLRVDQPLTIKKISKINFILLNDI